MVIPIHILSQTMLVEHRRQTGQPALDPDWSTAPPLFRPPAFTMARHRLAEVWCAIVNRTNTGASHPSVTLNVVPCPGTAHATGKGPCQ